MRIVMILYIFSFLVILIECEIQFIIPNQKIFGKIWYKRLGERINLPCFNGDNLAETKERYRGAMFDWVKRNRTWPVLGPRRTIHGDGTLVIENLQLSDTGSLLCLATKQDSLEYKEFMHTVIVYTIVEFYLSTPFVYSLSECNEQTRVKQHDLVKFLCKKYSDNDEDNCPFTAKQQCLRKAISEDEEGFRLRITIEQKPSKNYKVLHCDVRCMKRDILTHLQQEGENLLAQLTAREANNSGKFYGYIFEKEEQMLGRKMRVFCPDGYYEHLQIACVPCLPGTSLKHEEGRNLLECSDCEDGFYQDKFASETCLRCPKLGSTAVSGARDIKQCKSSIQYTQTVVSIFGVILVAIAIVFLICHGKYVSVLKKKEKLLMEAGINVYSKPRGSMLTTTVSNSMIQIVSSNPPSRSASPSPPKNSFSPPSPLRSNLNQSALVSQTYEEESEYSDLLEEEGVDLMTPRSYSRREKDNDVTSLLKLRKYNKNK